MLALCIVVLKSHQDVESSFLHLESGLSGDLLWLRACCGPDGMPVPS